MGDLGRKESEWRVEVSKSAPNKTWDALKQMKIKCKHKEWGRNLVLGFQEWQFIVNHVLSVSHYVIAENKRTEKRC